MLGRFEIFFTVIFTLEMVVKVVALGCWRHAIEEVTHVEIASEGGGTVKRKLRKRAAVAAATDVMGGQGYFQSGWNRLDFIVVVESITSLILLEVMDNASVDLSAVRSLRVLRPLRTINHLPGLKMMVRSFMDSIPMLVHSLMGFLIYFLIFDILGINLFAGSLRKRCFGEVAKLPASGAAWTPVPGALGWARANDDVDGMDDRLCGGQHSCPANFSCLQGMEGTRFGMNPNFGVTSFDNIYFASLVLMQGITLEGWSEVMYMAQDAVSSSAWLYFLPMVVLGAFIMLNLVLAVIVTKFKEASAMLQEEVRLTKLRRYEVYFLGIELRKKHSAMGRWKAVVESERAQEEADRLTVSSVIRKTVTAGGGFLKASLNIRKNGTEANLAGWQAQALASRVTGAFRGLGQRLSLLAGTGGRSLPPVRSSGGAKVVPTRGAGGMQVAVVADGQTTMVSQIRRASRRASRRGSAELPSALPALTALAEADDERDTCSSFGSDTMEARLSTTGLAARPSNPRMAPRMSRTSFRDAPGAQQLVDDATMEDGLDSIDLGASTRVSKSASSTQNAMRAARAREARLALASSDAATAQSGEAVDEEEEKDSSAGPCLSETLFAAQKVREQAEQQASVVAAKMGLRAQSDATPSKDAHGSSGRLQRHDSMEVRMAGRRPSLSAGKSIQCGRNAFGNPVMKVVGDVPSTTWFGKLRSLLLRLVESRAFDQFMTLAIVLNTACLALDSYEPTPGHGTLGEFPDKDKVALLETFEMVFFVIFVVELLVKNLALGLKKYVSDSFNVFDAFTVSISVVERILLSLGGSINMNASAFRVVRVFRLFRVLRIARLARRMKFMAFVFKVMAQSIGSAAWVSLLLLLFSLIFSVLGMQLFAGRFNSGVDAALGVVELRNNFDSLLMSFISVFQILSGEDWHRIMYHGVRVTGPAAALFFVAWVCIGQFILLNIFLAVILQYSEEPSEADVRVAGGAKRASLAVQWIGGHMRGWRHKVLKPMQKKIHTDLIMKQISGARVKRGTVVVPSSLVAPPLPGTPAPRERTGGLVDMVVYEASDDDISDAEDERVDWLGAHAPEDMLPFDPSHSVRQPDVRFRRMSQRAGHHMAMMSMRAKSCWGRAKHWWRIYVVGKCRDIVTYKWFDSFILTFIIFSSLALALESPRTKDDKALMDFLNTLEMIFTAIFSLEVFLRSIAHGLLFGSPKAYLRSSWNRLDFVVVVSAWVTLLFNMLGLDGDFSSMRALRMLRCLRPLRVISRYPGMRKVVGALLLSFWPMMNVILVLMLVWLMFAIIGVQLFGGKFRYCPPGTELTGAAGNATADCLNGTPMVSHDMNFDNVESAMMVLFTVSSLEGWPQIMWNAVDGTGSKLASFYFIFFILLGVFFFLNLFVLTIFRNFMFMKQTMEGVGFLTPEQQNWVDAQKRIMASGAARRVKMAGSSSAEGVSWWRRSSWRIVHRRWFEPLCMAVIASNILLMASQGLPSSSWPLVLEQANVIYVVLYTVEMLLKVAALGFRQYIVDRWNQLDFSLVMLSIFDMAMTSMDGGAVLTVRILRLTRLVRVVRVVKSMEGLQRIFLTIYLALPSLVNVGSLLVLLFFIFAVLGVQLFGAVPYGSYMNNHANFRDVLVSAITLFRCSTGEGWQDIMTELKQVNSTTASQATAFFIVFLTLASYMLINLFVMVLIDTFDNVNTRARGMRDEHMDDFKECWSVLDPGARHVINAYQTEALVRMLMQPLGLGPYCNAKELFAHLRQMGLKCVGGRVEYHKVFLSMHNVTFGSTVHEKAKKDTLQKADRAERKRRETVAMVSKIAGEGGVSKAQRIVRRLSQELGLMKQISKDIKKHIEELESMPTEVIAEVGAFRIQCWVRGLRMRRLWGAAMQLARSPKLQTFNRLHRSPLSSHNAPALTLAKPGEETEFLIAQKQALALQQLDTGSPNKPRGTAPLPPLERTPSVTGDDLIQLVEASSNRQIQGPTSPKALRSPSIGRVGDPDTRRKSYDLDELIADSRGALDGDEPISPLPVRRRSVLAKRRPSQSAPRMMPINAMETTGNASPTLDLEAALDACGDEARALGTAGSKSSNTPKRVAGETPVDLDRAMAQVAVTPLSVGRRDSLEALPDNLNGATHL